MLPRPADLWAPPLIDAPPAGLAGLTVLCGILCAPAEGGSTKAAARKAVRTNLDFCSCIFMLMAPCRRRYFIVFGTSLTGAAAGGGTKSKIAAGSAGLICQSENVAS
jgi:hypothetical protein